MAHQMPKPVIANCVPKLVGMATTLSTYGPPSNTIPTAHPTPQPKRHPYRFRRLCTDDRRVSLYFTMGRSFSPKICPFPWGDLDPNLIHGSPGPPKSSTQTAAQSVQTFLQGSLVLQTDRQTDRPRYSVGNNRPHLRT